MSAGEGQGGDEEGGVGNIKIQDVTLPTRLVYRTSINLGGNISLIKA